MLSWIYKNGNLPGMPKKPAPSVAPSPPPPAQPQRDPELAAKKAQARAEQTEQARALWAPRLTEAHGDDAALLQVAESAPLLDIKLAAVQALANEDALKRAERHFRSHDRKVHSVAKARLETLVTTREHRARAEDVIAAATTLLDAPVLAANQLVALDRDWQALDPSVLEEAQQRGFADLRERLSTLVRERGELQQRLQRWTAQAQQALGELRLACQHAADSGDATSLRERADAVRSLLAARTDAAAADVVANALATALRSADQIQVRLAWYLGQLEPAVAASVADAAPIAEVAPEALPGHTEDATPTLASAPDEPAAVPETESTDAAVEAPPVDDADIARRLEHWFEARLAALRPEPATAPAPKVAAADDGRDKAAIAERRTALDARLHQLESALAEGHVTGLAPRLQSLDAALAALPGVGQHDALRTRLQALHAEHARLKGWQQWGGSRARDDLVAQAEKLALLVAPPAEGAVARPPKLNLKHHGDTIAMLRKRWKELDRLGAAASQALWQRFDTALTLAHQPVAAQQAALKAQREENLAAREALLTALEAVRIDAPGADAPQDAGPPGGTGSDAEPRPGSAAAHWRELARALDQFQQAWRPLGPLDHTVPAAARAGLQERLTRALERIETPLNEARGAAHAERERLIERAEALAADLAARPQQRDAIPRVRELQALWQQEARRVPLKRGIENALWARFKAATDAVFTQRDTAASARDAELSANLAQREALLARLTDLRSDTPAPDIERTLAEVDRAWRAPTELPRNALPGLEARLRDAHAAALRCLAASAGQQWQQQCEALRAKLALCDEAEAASPAATANPPAEGAADDIGNRWATLPALPPAWERALTQRRAGKPPATALSPTAINDLLLQLETALDVPTTPERQAARRELKLRALKQALEGRGEATTLEPARRAEGLFALLRQRGLDATQRERLDGLVTALRTATPGTLVGPTKG
jgi:DNA repair protein SbcC/Rad50